jgi:hypothetical protein
MGRMIGSLVLAASLLAVASSEASAWVCFATGLGSGARGRSYHHRCQAGGIAALRAP